MSGGELEDAVQLGGGRGKRLGQIGNGRLVVDQRLELRGAEEADGLACCLELAEPLLDLSLLVKGVDVASEEGVFLKHFLGREGGRVVLDGDLDVTQEPVQFLHADLDASGDDPGGSQQAGQALLVPVVGDQTRGVDDLRKGWAERGRLWAHCPHDRGCSAFDFSHCAQ